MQGRDLKWMWVDHLTSPHLTSPHLTSPHLTSPHLQRMSDWSCERGRSSSVFCLLSSVFCLLSSVFCLLSSVFCLLSKTIIFYLLSSIFYLLSSVLVFWRSRFAVQLVDTARRSRIEEEERRRAHLQFSRIASTGLIILFGILPATPRRRANYRIPKNPALHIMNNLDTPKRSEGESSFLQ